MERCLVRVGIATGHLVSEPVAKPRYTTVSEALQNSSKLILS